MAGNVLAHITPPSKLGISLMLLALATPILLVTLPTNRYLAGRYLAVKNWALAHFVHHIMLPLTPPMHKWAIYFTSIMTYLLLLNLMGLMPYIYAPTSNMLITLGLAIPATIATISLGMRTQPAHALAHLVPEGSPMPLVPFLILIETMSLLIRPLALGIRLAANLTAGHLLIKLLSSATKILISTLPLLALFTLAALTVMTLLELAVAVIQAYVFTLLLALYTQENV
nr:ATP synthase F0 subunit 6 [Aulostomus maculatus]